VEHPKKLAARPDHVAVTFEFFGRRKHQTNVDVKGLRDYRGVPVLAAWTWRPELYLGIATKVDPR
jgi:hypothetical protein